MKVSEGSSQKYITTTKINERKENDWVRALKCAEMCRNGIVLRDLRA
jgi:hypothetical protein